MYVVSASMFAVKVRIVGMQLGEIDFVSVANYFTQRL